MLVDLQTPLGLSTAHSLRWILHGIKCETLRKVINEGRQDNNSMSSEFYGYEELIIFV
jgi:hypothetical protein